MKAMHGTVLARVEAVALALREESERLGDAAGVVGDARAAAVLGELAAERATMAGELSPAPTRSRRGLVRALSDLRAAIAEADPVVVLLAAERAEAALEGLCESTLAPVSRDEPLADTLRRHVAALRSGRGRVRELREAYRP